MTDDESENIPPEDSPDGSDGGSESDAAYDDAIYEFEKARDAGQPLDPEEWIARHGSRDPAVVERLREYLRTADFARTMGRDAPFDLSDFSFYEVRKFLGKGGMGAVFRVHDRRLHRDAALKVPRHGVGSSPDVRRRLTLEAQVISQLQHPNIVPVFDVGHCRVGAVPAGASGGSLPSSGSAAASDVPFYVMRIVDGPTLTKVVKLNRQLPAEQHDGLLRKTLADFILVCNAVAFAHAKGIVHRDLKPDNISIGELGQVYVMDWGLAKDSNLYVANAADPGEPPQATNVIGTPGYMAPEIAARAFGSHSAQTPTFDPHAPTISSPAAPQATLSLHPEGAGTEQAGALVGMAADKRSDIYSLGATLYYILAGQAPYDDLERARWAEQIHFGQPVPLRQRERSIDKRLEAICQKAMARNPVDRYPTPDRLAGDLQSWLNDAPVSAYADSLRERAARWARQHRTFVWSATASAIVLLAAGLFYGYTELRHQAERAKLESDRKIAERNAELERVRSDKVKQEASASEYIGLTGKIAREELRRMPGWAERSWEMLQRAAKLETPYRNEVDLRSAAATVLVADELRQKSVTIFPDQCYGATYSSSGLTLALLRMSDNLRPNPTIMLVDAKSGDVRRVLEADAISVLQQIAQVRLQLPKSRFQSCAFVERDQALIAGTKDGRICRFDLTQKSSRPRKTVTLGSTPVAVHVMPGERFVLADCSGSTGLHCLDRTTLEPMGKPYPIDDKMSGISIPDGESVLVHGSQGTRWISLPGGAQKASFPVARGASQFHPERQFHPVGNAPDLLARNWPDGEPLHHYLFPQNAASARTELTKSADMWELIGYSPCGRALAGILKSAHGARLQVWDAWGGLPRWEIETPSGSGFKGLSISKDAERIAYLTDREVIQHSRIRPRLATSRTYGHPSGTRQVRVSPNRSELAVTGEIRKDGNNSIRFREIGDDASALSSPRIEKVGAGSLSAPDMLSYSPDNRWLVFPGSNEAGASGILVQDRSEGDERQLIPLQHRLSDDGKKVEWNASAFAGLGWSSGGALVAAIDYEVLAWDLTPRPARLIGSTDSFTLFGRPRPYVALAMNGSDTGWAITVRSELRPFRIGDDGFAFQSQLTIPGKGNPRTCRIDSSNQHLAIGRTDGSIVLYRTQSSDFGSPRSEAHEDSVHALAWLNDEFLVSGSKDGTLAVWNLTKDRDLALRYRIDIKAPIQDIAATADGSGVYVACTDEASLRIYNLSAIDRELQSLFSDHPLGTPTAPSLPDPIDLADVPFPAEVKRKQKPVDPQQAEQAALERSVAEYVVSMGGQIGLRDWSGRALPWSGMLPDSDFQVDQITLGDAPSDMERLMSCTRLSNLLLARIPNLTDEAFAKWNGKRIRSLVLDGCPQLTDAAIDTLAALEGLESLVLMRVNITDARLPALKSLTSLRSLTLSETSITDDGLTLLADACPKITQLNIHQSDEARLSIRGIRQFRNLESLTINGDQLTAESPDIINSIPTLHVLSISAPLSDAVVARVENLKSIRSLGLSSAGDESSTRLSPDYLSDAAWPKGIQTLVFNGAAASPRDEDLKALGKIPSLKMIIVGGTKGSTNGPRYTTQGFVELRKARPDVSFGIEESIHRAGEPFP